MNKHMTFEDLQDQLDWHARGVRLGVTDPWSYLDHVRALLDEYEEVVNGQVRE